MSLVDDTFGPIPGPLIQQWGQEVVFVQVNGSGTYDPDTGNVTEDETDHTVNAVITEVGSNEQYGTFESTDLKIMIDPGQIDDHYVTTADYWRIPKAGGTVTAKNIEVTTYRGDDPVFFICIARPQ